MEDLVSSSIGKVRPAAIGGIIVAAVLFSACAHFRAAPPEDRHAPGPHAALINGTNIVYHVHGTGPACIVQPGGPGLGWEYLRMPALEEQLTLVYIEPVGSGASGTLADPKQYTFERYASDIEGLRQHLGLERPYLLGHSHGGMVAQLYAVNHPHSLKGLILYATSPVAGKEWVDDLSANLGWYANEPWFNEALPAFMGMGTAPTADEAMARFRKAAGFYFADYTANKERADAAMRNIRCNLPPYQAFLTQPFDVRDQLPRVDAPTLVVGCRKDPILSVKFSGQIHDAIPGSRLAVLENSGHMAHVDQPAELAALVSGFVKDVEKTNAGK